MKAQVVVDRATRKVICTAFGFGKKQDFRFFKKSKMHMHPDMLAETDTGYVGIKKIHDNSILPKKRTKNKPLTSEDKAFNRKISSSRGTNEHAIGFIKRFRIVTEKYRNRRKQFRLRFNLITGICNYEL